MILREADLHNAESVIRPAELATDEAPSPPVVLHAIEAKAPETHIAVMVQCTAPFLTAADIDNVVRVAMDDPGGGVFAAVPYQHFLVDAAGNLLNRPWMVRHQDMPQQWTIAGSVFACSMDQLREKQLMLDFDGPRKPKPYPAEFPYLCDIDTLRDVGLARCLLKLV